MTRYLVVAAAVTLCPGMALGQRATFQGIGHLPDGAESGAAAVSADGRVVVGRAVGAEGPVAVRWTPWSGLETLEPLPGWGGPGWDWVATAASADGAAVVGYGTRPTKENVAFRWTPDTGMVDLGDLPGGETSAQARDISGDGSIVVGFSDAALPGGYPAPEAFRWTEAGGMETFLPVSYTLAFGISLDGTTIVGSYGYDGYHWTATEGMQLLECEDFADAVSGDGEVIVGFAGWGPSGFRWLRESGSTRSLAMAPDAWDGSATDVSANGRVIVGWSRGSGGYEASLWGTSLEYRSVQGVLVTKYGLDLTGWRLARALGVSADGTVIVGWGENPAGQEEGWVARLGNGPCYADCDASGAIDFFDFLCYQDSFAAAEPWADCDGSGGLDFLDFLCFQNVFVAGCP